MTFEKKNVFPEKGYVTLKGNTKKRKSLRQSYASTLEGFKTISHKNKNNFNLST